VDGKRATVAAYLKEGTVRIGVAICGRKDTFCRRVGRNIAIARAVHDHNNPLIVQDDKKDITELRKILHKIAEECAGDQSPNWNLNSKYTQGI